VFPGFSPIFRRDQPARRSCVQMACPSRPGGAAGSTGLRRPRMFADFGSTGSPFHFRREHRETGNIGLKILFGKDVFFPGDHPKISQFPVTRPSRISRRWASVVVVFKDTGFHGVVVYALPAVPHLLGPAILLSILV
jgi:hypothetical protein